MVEYRTGAGGSLGAEMAARAAPDGYTLFTGSNGPLTVNPFVQAKLNYDPLKDFVAIGLANLAPHCIAVHAVGAGEDPAGADRAVEEQAGQHRHRRRGQRDAHDARALQRRDRREHSTHVPYRGGGALVPDLLSGSITGAMTELSTALPQSAAARCASSASRGASARRRCPTCRP